MLTAGAWKRGLDLGEENLMRLDTRGRGKKERTWEEAKATAGSRCPESRKHCCHVCGGAHSAKANGCKDKKRL